MSHSMSLPNQIPILPLLDRDVLLPGLLLRLRITSKSSTEFLSHIPNSDQPTLASLVLGCVPVRPGSTIAGLVDEDEKQRPALPAPKSLSKWDKSSDVIPNASPEYGCAARIKNLTRLDRSYGSSGFYIVLQGILFTHFFNLHQVYLASESIKSPKSILISKPR